MKKLTTWGIRQRVVFLALAPVAVIAVALTAYFLLVRYDDIEAAQQRRGAAMVRQLAPAAEYGLFSGNRNELLRLANAIAREPDVVAVTIADTSQRVLARVSGPSPAVGTSPAPGVEVFEAEIRRPALPFEDPYVVASGPESPSEAPLGRVRIELSRAALEARKREILGVTLLTTLAVLIGGLLLARRLGRDITEPVLALEAAVGRLRQGELDVRIAAHRSGTLQALEGGFNEMAAALDAGQRRSSSALARSEAELARQLEIAEAKKEEAERASESKSRFLASASHDLRQPLHALTLFASELAASLNRPEERRLASQIMTAAGAIAELLDALLDISRLDIAAIVPQRRPIPLGPLLEACADAHRQSAAVKGLRLTYRPTHLWVDSDPQLLRRMVGNLLANAVRYTRKGRILLAVRRRGEQLRIEVWDTGIGIEAAHLPKLFHEFFQVGNPERDAAKGLGLGLAIVARLGAILGHQVAVRSRPGRGSMFSIDLPRALPAIEAAPRAAFVPAVAVLVADPELRDEVCAHLEAWQYDFLAIDPGNPPGRWPGGEVRILICDEPALAGIDGLLAVVEKPPALIVLGAGSLPAGLETAARLSRPLRPARLRALIRHVLAPSDAHADTGTDSAPATADLGVLP
jgi:signal transduction histidine kinase